MGKLSNLYPEWLKKIKKTNRLLPVHNKFIVSYGELSVGYLYTNKNREYVFEYTEEFKKQDKIKPLAGFADKNTIYRSKEFFPFFISRIPDPNRLLIKEIIEKKNIDASNPLNMLDKFGERTLDNPFIVKKVKTP